METSLAGNRRVRLRSVRRLKRTAGLLAIAVILGSVPSVGAQSGPPPKVYRERIEPHWLKSKAQFWYRNDNPGDTREFVFVDAEKSTREPAFDHASVARQIGGGAEADRLPVESLKFGDDGGSVLLIGKTNSWELERASGEIKEIGGTDGASVGLKPSAFVRPSRNGGEDTELTFENRLDREVALFWIDPSGNRVAYGTLQPGQKRDQHTFAGHSWLITEKDGKEPLVAFVAERGAALAVIDGETPKPRERRQRDSESKATFVRSPNGQWEAFVREDNLWLRSVETKKETPLTTDGVAKNSYHRDAIRERAIGMNYDKPDYPESLPEVYWSPDSKWLIALKTTVVPEPRVTLIESAPKGQLQPEQQSYPYIKPGGEVPQQEVHLFEADSGREFVVDQSAFTNQWDVGNFRWEKDSSRFTFLFNQRGHQVLRVIAVSAEREAPSTGTDSGSAVASPHRALVKTLIEETFNTFIDYSQKTYLNFLDKRGEILWMSERDGWNHLYLFDASTGALKRQLTKGEWVVREVERVDEDNGIVWFWTMGRVPGQDPYYRQLCRVALGAPTGSMPILPVTDGDGDHSVQWSPHNRFLIDTWSRVDQPPVHELRKAADGSLVCKLEDADASEIINAGYRFPERFTAKGRDGQTDIFGIIHFPINFEDTKKYPVIENIYAGPHGAFVPKSFHSRYRHQQEIADRGFVVVQIDGMGTNWRSRKFHDVAWKNLKDAGFPDRIAWMKAAAATRPWMDLTRVGIYGGSAGGQNAMRAVLDYADFYKAAAADCGCHDNRMDKIWWNEAWMGLPGDGSYAKSSNVEDAHKMGGALLLTVGELDKNVDPSSTYQVVGALQKAGKQFEFMPMIGAGHGSAESDFGRKLRADFFVRNFLGK